MKVEITILVDNTTPAPGFIGEYGYSALVTVDNKKILFDTGSADALLTNSKLLGLKPDEFDDIVISHGHFDHTGAVIPILEQYGSKTIYAHSNIFAKRPIMLGNNKIRDIGCTFTEQEAIDADGKFVFIDNFSEIFPNIYLTGEVSRITDYEDVGAKFQCEKDGELIDDKLIDDMALIVNHPDGLIIISGCAHSGVINIIEHALKKTGRNKILAFIGGTHLITASEERMNKTVAALREYSISQIIVSHCTGFYAAAKLYNELGSRVVKGETGMTFKF